MFSELMLDFEERVKEVDLFFLVLEGFDTGAVSVTKGTSPQVVAGNATPTDWLPMLKGTAYLVLYNLVEAFVRRGFQEVFEIVKAEKLTGIEVAKALRREWIIQRSRRVRAFDAAPKDYLKLASEIIDDVVDEKTVELSPKHLPFSGNLNAKEIREVFKRHGVNYSSNLDTRDGLLLDVVRRKRNTLSHGDESFTECGRQFSVSELMQTKNEVVVYMRGVLKLLEAYTTSRTYLASPQ